MAAILPAALQPALGITQPDDTVDLLVTIGKLPLAGKAAACLLDVSVTRTIGEAAQLTLRLAAWDSDSEQLQWVDDARFLPGGTIEIAMGYLGRREQIFHGDIVSLALEASPTARAVLTITAYDVLHRLGRGQQSTTYVDKTYAEIVREVARRYNLDADAPDNATADQNHASINHPADRSDLAFLLDLAREIDYELFARGAKLVFRKSRYGGSAQLTLDASRDLLQLSAHISATSQLGGVDVKILSSETKEILTVSEPNAGAADSAYSTAPTRAVLFAEPLTTQVQARLLAKAELARMRRGYLEASGTALGRPDLEPGMMIRIDNLGKRFGGAYYVTSVTHSMSESGGLRTSFTLKGEPR